ncbi:UDP-N-acetylmuramoylalanyl-D-glutamyl-2,6-diaminopimelate--D-alanyl-D-alanine ligase [Polycladidibacter stylochi]|uniref:UDP-N-acetylmuramoylalanyl-D-glutamyl-2, 6-diaminopimelate--D-alanyl-D-alanine ligase n=1 Tax=Polycladidibacter stylochi TaxID=1807766 RepID=UPI00082D0327|nr:UDP-N-acetylmuramoylalanyl-D-glutamyl-2,6-diaminopimelate--D-alanyl-D-alanine ligase [Pseudovibrio stylochi]
MLLEDLIIPETLEGEGTGVEITGITADSRQVEPGFAFIALKGEKVDGAQFIGQAVANQAAAIIIDENNLNEEAIEAAGDCPLIDVRDARALLPLMAAKLHSGQPETMVAVTGTSGKTSVAVFVREIFEFAGQRAASLGTIGTVTSDGQSYGGLTTPDPVSLHKDLSALAGDGITHAAMEASSHGLDQHRLDGVVLKAAAFTNLGRDHMDYHSSVEDYLAAKLRLFGEVLPADGVVVVDPSEPYAERIVEIAKARGQEIFSVGREGNGIKLISSVSEGFVQLLELEVAGEMYFVQLPLAGAFQVSNALLAAGLAMAVGIAPKTVLAALEELKGASGRLELVGKSNGGLIYIDYAHKPDALENVLKALRPYASGRLICVMGCGGDRDTGKRALMGEISSRLADVTIVTDDNPRSEDPAAIRLEIMAAAVGAIEIGDRSDAIVSAVDMLGKGDVLVVAGKGHETGQIVNGEVLPFSDHEAVQFAIDLQQLDAQESAAEMAQAEHESAAVEAVADDSPTQEAEDAALQSPHGDVAHEEKPRDALPKESRAENADAGDRASESAQGDVGEGAKADVVGGQASGDVPGLVIPMIDVADIPVLPAGMPVEDAPLWTLEEFVFGVDGRIAGTPAAAITGISIDSRDIKQGEAYFAILGDVHDGHAFAGAALENGAALAVVAEEKLPELPENGAYIVVEDVLASLRRLGVCARARSKARIVAVTGSVGKTSSKEALRLALAASGKTHASVKSFNNHWGVPLSLARLPRDADFGVFEIGMNHSGEITPLVQLVRPHCALITGVEPVHMAHFESIEDVARAKAEIFCGLEPGGTAVLNRDNKQYDLLRFLAVVASVPNIVSYGLKPGADVWADKLALLPDCSCLTANYHGQELTYKVGAPGEHHVINSLGVLSVAGILGADLALAAMALSELKAPRGRGAQVELNLPNGKALLLDESYNANPASMKAALELQATLARERGGRSVAVLGDMLELGHNSERYHRGLSRVIAQCGTSQVYCVGPMMKALYEQLPEHVRGGYAPSAKEMKDQLLSALQSDDTLMIKGSLGSKMGVLVKAIGKRFTS